MRARDSPSRAPRRHPERHVDEWRRGMHCSYVVGWLRTEENQYPASPLETVRELSRRSLELLATGRL